MDDEEIIRDMAIKMLVYPGYRVTNCENGYSAMAKPYKAVELALLLSPLLLKNSGQTPVKVGEAACESTVC